MKFNNITERFGRKKIIENDLENSNIELESLEDLKEIYNEFEGGEWEEEGELNNYEAKQKFENDGDILDADQEEDHDYWNNESDPEITKNTVDIENIADDTDHYAQFDNLTFEDILSGYERKESVEGIPKKLPPMGVEKFKRMQLAKEYATLMLHEQQVMDLRPKRGDRVLSIDEIKEEYAKFKKATSNGNQISQLEYEFGKRCHIFLWAYDKIKDNNPERPVAYPKPSDNPEMQYHNLTNDQIKAMVAEYDAFKKDHPEDFEIMRLEAFAKTKLNPKNGLKVNLYGQKKNTLTNKVKKQCDGLMKNQTVVM